MRAHRTKVRNGPDRRPRLQKPPAAILSPMLNFINRALVGLHTGEDGQTFVEYALILAGVSVAIALAAMWTGLATSLGSAVTQVSSAIGP